MKVFVSMDLEGLAGIASWSEVAPKISKEVAELVEEHVKAVLRGIEESGVSVDQVLIADSHAAGDNIPYAITRDCTNVSVVRGALRRNYMMSGLDGSFDRVIFLGYHAGVGTLNAVMDHTYSGSIVQNIWINNMKMNEALINAGFAGHFDVPLALVVGDSSLKRELEDAGLNSLHYVVTKEGLSRYAAVMKPLKVVLEEIRIETALSMKCSRSELPVVKYETPVQLKMELKDTSFADGMSLMPGVKRLDGRTIVFESDDYEVVFNALLAALYIGYSIKGMK